jgi:hypothetical protein
MVKKYFKKIYTQHMFFYIQAHSPKLQALLIKFSLHFFNIN